MHEVLLAAIPVFLAYFWQTAHYIGQMSGEIRNLPRGMYLGTDKIDVVRVKHTDKGWDKGHTIAVDMKLHPETLKNLEKFYREYQEPTSHRARFYPNGA